MGENADLQKRTVEALLHYHKALAKVEALEHEEAVAHRALVEWRGCAEKSTFDAGHSMARSHLIESGQHVISRLHEVRFAMSEATAELKSAFTVLAAIDDALGCLPIPEKTDSNVNDAGGRSEE